MLVKKILGGLVFVSLIISFGVQNIIASAATLDITLNQIETGSPDFDNNDDPGNDSSITNNIVRTNDTILYEWDFNVNGGSDDNVTIVQVLPNTAKWIFLPLQCGAGSSISADEQTITCVYDLDSDNTNGNTIPSGTTVQLFPQAKARGTSANSDSITTSATIVGDNSALAASNSVSATISAAPRFDIEKRPAFETFVPSDGIRPDGYLATIPILVKTEDNAKGSEMLDPSQPLIITDTFGFDDGSTPDSELELATWVNGFCGDFVNFGYSGGQLFRELGLSSDSISVSDSGTAVCTQPDGPGTPITVTINDADLSGDHIPTSFWGSSPIPNGDAYVIALAIRVFEPLTSIPENEVRFIENTLSGVFPNSISGQGNYGTGNEIDLTNNTNKTRFRNLNGGNSNKASQIDPYPWSSGIIRDLYSGEEFYSVLGASNSWIQSHTGLVSCDKFDHTTQEYLSTTSNRSYAYTVDYGQKAFVNFTDMGATTCEDNEPGVTWSSTPQANTNIIRIKQTEPLPSGESVNYLVNYKVRNAFYDDAYEGSHIAGDVIPGGFLIRDFLATKRDNFDSGNWDVSRFEEHRFNPNIPEIEKTLSPDTGNNQFISGGTVRFLLEPTILGIPDVPTTTTATITDTLPSYLSYQVGSATLAGAPREPDTVVVNTDGTTTMTWILPNSPVGLDLDDIEFSTTVSQATPNFEFVTNTVEINTPETTAPFEERSDTQDIQVLKDAVFSVSKLTTTPQIQVGETLTYILQYTNSRNDSIPGAVLIDVLPFNGDGRATPSDFSGTIEFDSLTGDKGGETYYYTKAAPASINTDDNDPSNVINTPGATTGTTVWCLPGDFATDADCPASNAEVTAFRVDIGSIPNNGIAYNFTLNLNTNGNEQDDIYTNHFEVAPDGLLNVISNEVSNIVVDTTIGDYVWNDQNQNGIQDEAPSEGINGVLATLWDAGADMLRGGGDDTQVTLDASGNAISPQTTADDANGNPGYFLFRNLLPSWYYVVFDNIPNFFSPTEPGDVNGNGAGDGTDDSDVEDDSNSANFLSSTEQELSLNEGNRNVDLGLFEEQVDLELTKQVDGNEDGTFGDTEIGALPGFNGSATPTTYDYRLTINNVSASINATGVTVQDAIPAGVTIAAANPSIGSVTTALPVTGPATLEWVIGDVDAQDNHTLDLDAEVSSLADTLTGSFVNTAQVTAADQTDVDSTTNNANNPFDTNTAEDDENQATIVFDGGVQGHVFEDTDGDGIQDLGETRIEGVTVTLYSDPNGANTVAGTAITNSNGEYFFSGITDPSVEYQIEFDHSTAPSGYTPSPEDQTCTSNGGSTLTIVLPQDQSCTTDSDGDVTTGIVSDIFQVPAGQIITGIDQGYVPLLSIGDFVFEDLNANGIQDSGEGGVEGVTINLYDAAALTPTILQSTASGTDGSYSFDNLNPALQYIVEFDHTSATGYTPSSQAQGTDTALDSDGDVTTGQTPAISFIGGLPNLDSDQGYIPLLSLGDLVFEDRNNSGTLDGTEFGIAGVTVNIYQDIDNDGIFDGGTIDTLLPFGTGSALPGTSVTDANGNYLFTDLLAGGYFIVIPASNFAPGDPLEGFTPTSGQNGSVAGNYETAPDANTDIDSDDNGTLNANGDYVSSLIVLSSNGEPADDADTDTSTNTTIDFGLYRMSCVSSLVWEDLNGDGVRDANEPLFSGVEVILYDDNNNEIGRTVSDANGEYEFCYLIEGDYAIEYASLPLGYQLTGNDQDSQADPSTFRTPTFSVGYNEQGQTLIESGVVSSDTLESINLIRTGRVNLNRHQNQESILYIVTIITGIGTLLFICSKGLQKR